MTLLIAAGLIRERTEGETLEPGAFLLWCLLPFMALITLRLFGMSFGKAVALRMDKDGISGFFAGPAGWSDIAHVGVLERDVAMKTYALPQMISAKRSLGVALRDPIGFRDRQTAWDRLRSWWFGRATGYHFIISAGLTEDRDVDAVLKQAQAFMQAHPEPEEALV